MKYILHKFCCNSELQTAVLIYGVLTSVFSGILLITTLSTDIFKDRMGNTIDPHFHYFVATPLFWIMVFASIVHMLSSIFLAIGVEKKNVYMFVPWMIVQALTLAPAIPFIIVVFLCSAVVAFPVYIWWAIFSLFVSLRAEEAQDTVISPSAVEATATAPSHAVLYGNTFDDIPLPAYSVVVPGCVTKKN